MPGFIINCFQLGNTKYVRLKVLSKRGSSQGKENKACSFSYVFTSCELRNPNTLVVWGDRVVKIIKRSRGGAELILFWERGHTK